MIDGYLVGLLWSFVLGASILLWPVSFLHKRALLNVWLAKIFTTLGFMLAFESRYEGQMDAVRYYHESHLSSFSWQYFEFGEGTTNVINFAKAYLMLLPDSYHAMKVTFAMFGMIAVYIFYRAATIFIQRDDIRFFYILALYPSILFWSSILGKDPLVLLGVSLYVYGVIGWRQYGEIRYLLWGVLGVWFATFMRLWYGPILVAPLFIFFLNKKTGWMSKIIFAVIVIFSLSILSSQFSERFQIESTEDLLKQTSNISESFSQGGSGQKVEAVTSPTQMIAMMPFGMFTALFRPLPGEILNLFGLIAGFENLFLLWLLYHAIKNIEIKDLTEPVILWAIALLLIWASIYGFVSIGNLGSAVRYRLAILPVLIGLVFYLYFKSSYQISKVKFKNSKILKNKKVILKFKV
jgi:hypothetical protein